MRLIDYKFRDIVIFSSMLKFINIEKLILNNILFIINYNKYLLIALLKSKRTAFY